MFDYSILLSVFFYLWFDFQLWAGFTNTHYWPSNSSTDQVDAKNTVLLLLLFFYLLQFLVKLAHGLCIKMIECWHRLLAYILVWHQSQFYNPDFSSCLNNRLTIEALTIRCNGRKKICCTFRSINMAENFEWALIMNSMCAKLWMRGNCNKPDQVSKSIISSSLIQSQNRPFVFRNMSNEVQVEKDVEAGNTGDCLWWMWECEQVGFQLSQETIARESQCVVLLRVVRSFWSRLTEVRGEQVENSKELVPCSSMIGWISWV